MKTREVVLTAAGCAAGRLAGKINAMIVASKEGKMAQNAGVTGRSVNFMQSFCKYGHILNKKSGLLSVGVKKLLIQTRIKKGGV